MFGWIFFTASWKCGIGSVVHPNLSTLFVGFSSIECECGCSAWLLSVVTVCIWGEFSSYAWVYFGTDCVGVFQ